MSKIDKVEELQNILKEDASNFQARRQLAVLLLDMGYPEEAKQHLLYLSKIFTDDSGIFYNLGITYEKLKDLNSAEKAYNKAIELAPDEIDSYYNLGLVYIDKKIYDKAIDCFETVLQKDNNDSNAYFSIGLCYFKEGKLDGAKYYFQRTIDLNDEDIYAQFYIGNILKEQGNNDEAREKFHKVLELSPDYSWAYFNLAAIDYEEGDTNSAIENLKKTLELNPKDIDAYETYAKILTKAKKYDNAAVIIEQALDNCGANGDLFYILAQIQKLRNDREEFVKNMTEAMKYYTSLSVSPKAVKKELDKFLNK